MSVAELERRYPAIAWLEPIQVTVESVTRWCCRICIARDGLAGADIHTGAGYETREEAAAHIVTHSTC